MPLAPWTLLLHAPRERLPGLNIVLLTMSKTEQIEALRQRRITVGFNRMMPVLRVRLPSACWPSTRSSSKLDHCDGARGLSG